MAQYTNSSSALGGLMSTASAAAAIAADPALPTVVNLVLKLKAMEKSDSSGPGRGVGLRNVVGPLQTYVKVQEQPWLLPVTVIGVFSLIFAAGYFTRKAMK